MGNSKSKKVQKEPDKFFERERWKEQRREEIKKKNINPTNKRLGINESPLPPVVASVPAAAPPRPPPPPSATSARQFDVEAIDRMRYQLHNDSDAFLLNNILLSVQFFENFERELRHIKDNPMSNREHQIDEAMVHHHKHVFFADRLQECVHEHVRYCRRKSEYESLAPSRLYVIYDNVEASEPGDTSDYSAVLDAPFYKLRVEDCKELGYVKLKKLEILESTAKKDTDLVLDKDELDIDSIYSESEKESNCSDGPTYGSGGEISLKNLKSKIIHSGMDKPSTRHNLRENNLMTDISQRRQSGSTKSENFLVENNKNYNSSDIHQSNDISYEGDENIRKIENDIHLSTHTSKSGSALRKSILKNGNNRMLNGTNKKIKKALSGGSDNLQADDTETSGYRSNSSSRQNESSETESDYGYATITESTTPKPIELSLQSNFAMSSGVLPDECFTQIHVKALENWSEDDEDETLADSKDENTKNLYDIMYFLNSDHFMSNFVDNFMIKLGKSLSFSQDTINNALTQGASIYCKSKHDLKFGHEIIPAIVAAWPNAANQWIIRERRIVQNPRTNFSYQWPTKYMVSKAVGFGCMLVPLGFRPKRGMNPDQKLQWKIIFPAAERYLESCLAHSHIRCYLFALALQKSFMENETFKIGIDPSHLKNHLFWQCEDNYAKWPEDRLGESLRLFMRSFYSHFGHAKFPNYFIENCNDFKGIPKPLLLKIQRKIADILEAPVMHVLYALQRLTHVQKDFYPIFNVMKLYHILTCRNPLRLLNPNLQKIAVNNNESSESEEDLNVSFWDKAKMQDKQYQWKKERQRQMQQRRKTQSQSKKPKSSKRSSVIINPKIILPKRLEAERRRLVLEFFIPHFIAMARSSERFEAVKQAIIYLEQAQRLCILLQEEPAGETSAIDYLEVISDKLSDCQRKLANQSGLKQRRQKEIRRDRDLSDRTHRQRPKYEHMVSQDSPVETSATSHFIIADVHSESYGLRPASIRFTDVNESDSEEESKL